MKAHKTCKNFINNIIFKGVFIMSKKKFFAFLISIISTLSLASCGTAEINTPASQPESEKTAAEVTTTKEKENNNADTTTAQLQETETVVTEATEVSEASTITEQTKNPKEEETEELSLIDEITKKASDKSPILNGYSEYTQILNNFYTLDTSQTGYKYGYNTDDKQMISTTAGLQDSYGTITNITDNSLTPDDMEKFQELYEYIKENVDRNYLIYDAYIEEYYEEYNAGESGTYDFTDEGKGYHIDIVLEKDMNNFNNASPADRHMFLTRLENDVTEGTIKDGFAFKELEIITQENFIKEANEINPDIAFGIDDISISTEDMNDDTIQLIHTPFRRAIRKCDMNEITNQTDSWYANPIQNTAYAVNKGSLKATDQYTVNMDVSLYFKAGTNPDIILDTLKSFTDLFEKYNVYYITVDILDYDANFDSYKNANGYVSYEIVKSKARYYFCNNPADDFQIGGK